MTTIIKQITEKAYDYIEETLVEPTLHMDAAKSILTDYLYGAFNMYNMLHEDKLDYEEIIYIVEAYEAR